MLTTKRARRGMVTSPHHLASQTGLAILREGGNAIEATVAAAATIAVVMPAMNGIGGDAFWLVAEGDRDPEGIEACGAAGAKVDRSLYRGLAQIPIRGPLAANTVAGAISGWIAAIEIARRWGGKMPLARLLEDAIHYAEAGVPVSDTLAGARAEVVEEIAGQPNFAATFMSAGRWPAAGAPMRQPALAGTFKRLAKAGLEEFYRGELARAIAADLARVGSPLILEDLNAHRARTRTPLTLTASKGRFFNFPPPSQGIAALMILGQFDRLGVREPDGFDHLHSVIEATKQAYEIRDRVLGDPARMTEKPEDFLTPAALDRLAAGIDRRRAKPRRAPTGRGDTIWMGAIDGEGRATSHIQSVFWQFGSGVVLPETGIVWQNRGSAFSLDERSPNALAPGRKPFHTLNPAMALLNDGRLVTYGTMGAHGQPQYQAAAITRYVWFERGLQASITAPKWFVDGDVVRVESRFAPETVAALREAGHTIELHGPFESLFGHTHAIARRPDGQLEGACDPRSDGVVAAF